MNNKSFKGSIYVAFFILSLFYQTISAQKVVKILAIGNSFSEDAVESYLGGLASQKGYKYIIANLFIGGCSLQTHWTNAEGDLPKYSYRKIIDGNRVVIQNRTLLSCLKEEDWDYITFQQASQVSGQVKSYYPYLINLVQYVKSNTSNPNVKFALHQTWAYAKNSTHSGYDYYGSDQTIMYDSIVVAINKASQMTGIKMIIPSGTAIQNGRNSYMGDTFNRDGYHLTYGLGRYTAACAWFETIFGQSVIGNSFVPANVTREQAEIAQKAAHAAVLKPNSVSPLCFKNIAIKD